MCGKFILGGIWLFASTAVTAQVTPTPQSGDGAIAGSTAGGQEDGASAVPNDAIAGSERAAPSTVAQDDVTGIGDIVVTAQRRSENLTSVPLSISAQTGAALSASGIKDLSDVRFTTPGMLSSSGTGYTQIYIRGIGNGVFVGADPSIATFVDDVPHVYGSLVEDLVNVERVEVLKGAQGGLYGRNASGGVINIITRQPGDKFSALVRLTGATYGTFQGSAYVNMPLSNRLAWNFSLTRNWHAPYRKNVALRMPYNATNAGDAANAARLNQLAHPGKLNNQDVWSFDTKLRVKLTDTFKITLGADYSDDHDASGNGWLPQDLTRTYGTYLFLANLNGVTDPIDSWPKLSKNSDKSYGAIPNKSWTEDYGASVKAELGLEGVNLTSITALRFNNSQFQGDIGASPVPVAGFTTNFRRHYFYQELRAVSSGTGPFRWLGGASYFKDHVDAFIQGLTLGVPGPITASKLNTWNWSIYGQGAYDITDKLTFQASLRYAHEKKTVDFPPSGSNPAVSDVTKVHKWIPAATLSYKVPGGTVYARYAKGFKTGGPNPLVRPDRITTADKTGLILKPETVDTYEVGYRATLFDRKVQFTSAAFYNKYKGIHVVTAGTAGNADISNALINLGSARTYGAEAAITWRVSPPLTLSGNIGYLNAKYQKADFPGNALLLPRFSSGNRMILAPKWQGGFQVNYDQPINDNLRFQGNLLYSYISSHNFGALEEKFLEEKGYSLVNIRAGIRTVNDHLGLYLFVNNVFDKRYWVFGSSSSVGAYDTPGNPRLIGGTVEVKF